MQTTLTTHIQKKESSSTIKTYEIKQSQLMDVNKIEFLDLLGQGAFGKVRLARKLKEGGEMSTDDESFDSSNCQQETE